MEPDVGVKIIYNAFANGGAGIKIKFFRHEVTLTKEEAAVVSGLLINSLDTLDAEEEERRHDEDLENNMTAKRAKEILLEKWRYFAEHPEVALDQDLPFNIFRNIRWRDPLCYLFFKEQAVCPGCPLKRCNQNSLSYKWERSSMALKYSKGVDIEERRDMAKKFVAILEKWNPKE